jgi:3-hydroxyisobutyrate dehydrogenase
MADRIAVIGMEQMGSGMARRLVSQGHDVLGYDVNTQTRQALRKEGLAVAESSKAAVADRSVILTSIPQQRSVRHGLSGGLVELRRTPHHRTQHN